VDIITINGKQHLLKFLGEGSFKDAYGDELGNVYLFGKYMPELHLFNQYDNPHLPRFDFLGKQENGEEVFRTQFSHTLTKKDFPQLYNVYTTIDKIHQRVMRKYSVKFVQFKTVARKGKQINKEFLKDVKNDVDLSIYEALSCLVEICNTLGDTWFVEFTARNLGVKNDKLIFRDSIYNRYKTIN
jgi:hypothetical protein